ncbi:glypican-5-like isoform X2 [Limulus polyphemus]|uniref:Glypican-5-like isoform X2 n=1 Tax=Limulus polyphemus TaxID=6850 RepID=A0ABM1TPK9_LIMPO|nr:glypican-5-like isoform X2 [Limulus polyphemus]
MEPDVQTITGQLYSGLKDFLQGKNIDLEIQLSEFFTSIFPHVYRHIINDNLADFGDEFTNCLRKAQPDIKPFGARPKSLSLRVVKSFEDVRTFLEALSLGLEVVNTTDRQVFGAECKKALVRMTYCAHCRGLTAIKPCSGYCLNVARGCLAQVTDMDHPWNEFVTGLELIVSGMITDHNIEKLLTIMDVKISESIIYAMEQGGEITTQVQRRCDDGQRTKRSAPPTSVPPIQDSVSTVAAARNFNPMLFQQLQTFVQNLADFKGYYGNLADSVCNNGSWASRSDVRCWNGNETGEYRKTIAGSGTGAQKYNPEVTIDTKQDLMVTYLVNKLVHMRRLLTLQITRTPVAESLIVSETGSGDENIKWKDGGIQDDEDYYYFESGSGYLWGSARTESDIHFDKEVETPLHIEPQDGKGNVANGTQNNFILLVSVLIIIIMDFVA